MCALYCLYHLTRHLSMMYKYRIVLLFFFLAGVQSQWLTVCDHENRICGCYSNNTADYRQIASFLSPNGPMGDGYTLLISPYEESCSGSDCWNIKTASEAGGPLVTWRIPQLIISFNYFTIRSAYNDTKIVFEADEYTARAFAGAAGTGVCSTFKVTGKNVTVQDMSFVINATCVDWKDEPYDLTDLSNIVYSASDVSGGYVHNIESVNAVSVVSLIVPTTISIMNADGFLVEDVTSDPGLQLHTAAFTSDIINGTVTINNCSNVYGFNGSFAMDNETVFYNISTYVAATTLSRGRFRDRYKVGVADHNSMLIVLSTVGGTLILLLVVDITLHCMRISGKMQNIVDSVNVHGIGITSMRLRKELERHKKNLHRQIKDRMINEHSSKKGMNSAS